MSQTSQILRVLRSEALDIYRHALESVKVDRLMRDAVRLEDDSLVLGCCQSSDSLQTSETQLDLKLYSPHVIGGGKSVLAMACELARIVGQARISELFSHGLISLPGGLKSCSDDVRMTNLLQSIGVKCLFGSESNVPNRDSIHATEMLFNEVEQACRKDELDNRIPLFIVLLSGGGSSCLTSPRYISLEDKLGLINSLVQRGADIVELNKVRRFFSNVKGGKLARRIFNREPRSRVVTLILSDVIGDPIEYIASGPTYLNHTSTHYSSMLQVLDKYNLQVNFDNVEKETDTHIGFENHLANYVIGNNSLALNAAIKRAKELKYQVRNLGNCLNGSTETILDHIWCSRYHQPTTSNETMHLKTLVIGGGEATIKKLDSDGWGKGGRGQEMVLDYLIRGLEEKLPPDEVSLFLAGSTDGQDGPTDVAACMASVGDGSSRNSFSLQEVIKAKRSHDSFNFFTKYQPDSLVKFGLTGTNVMDLYMLLSLSRNKHEKLQSNISGNLFV